MNIFSIHEFVYAPIRLNFCIVSLTCSLVTFVGVVWVVLNRLLNKESKQDLVAILELEILWIKHYDHPWTFNVWTALLVYTSPILFVSLSQNDVIN